MKTCISASNAPSALGPYNHATEANGFVFVSGQIGIDPVAGKMVEGGVEAQARQALENTRNILAAAGCTMLDVVKSLVFLTDMNDFAAINEIYKDAFGKEFPARSCIEVSKLPGGAVFEMEVIAAKS